MNRLTRRTFIRHIAAAGTLAPLALPRLARAASANGKLNIAFVGASGQANFSFEHLKEENIIAVADVDSEKLAERLTWAAGLPGAMKEPASYRDYRQMLDREQKNIDAVVVATPDHHHAHAGLRALNMGKHLYCEKPLAHTVQEVRLMIEAAQRNKVATQMGTQIHAGDNYRRVVEKIRAGVIGNISEVHCWLYGNAWHGQDIAGPADPVPPNLDWDLWLGPAAMRDYHDKAYHPFAWRGWWDFGGGGLSDFGCHFMDLPHWALNLRHATTVQAFGPEPDPLRPPKSLRVEFDYPATSASRAVKLTWHLGTHLGGPLPYAVNVFEKYGVPEAAWKGNGIMFVGDGGVLISNYSQNILFPQEKFKDVAPPPESIATSPGHHAEWVRGCKEGTPTLCNFEYSGALTETVLLGLISHRAGNTKIEFDPATLKVSGGVSNAAAQFATKPYRAGWEITRLV